MEMHGELRIAAPREQVWERLNDPETLKKCIPGCEEMVSTGENRYNAKLTAGVGPVKGVFTATVSLQDIVAPEHYTIAVEGKGQPGFVKGLGELNLKEENGGTSIQYTGEVNVGGLLAMTPPSAADEPMRNRILNTIDETVTAVQRISSELRPSVLDDLGLATAIEAEAVRFEHRTGIECALSLPDHAALHIQGAAATAIYRIVQEALTNVSRHANATRIELRLSQQPGELLLEIRDDGRGITAAEVSDRFSLGLIGIRERADLVGATVRFEGQPGRGTIVSVRIPAPASPS